jgi:hypothetical protein
MGILQLKIISDLRWLYLGEMMTFADLVARCSASILAARLLKADSHIAYRAHAAPMPFPCHAVPLTV